MLCLIVCEQEFFLLTSKTVKFKSRMTQIICQQIPDRLGSDTESMQSALDSLWRGTISSL